MIIVDKVTSQQKENKSNNTQIKEKPRPMVHLYMNTILYITQLIHQV